MIQLNKKLTFFNSLSRSHVNLRDAGGNLGGNFHGFAGKNPAYQRKHETAFLILYRHYPDTFFQSGGTHRLRSPPMQHPGGIAIPGNARSNHKKEKGQRFFHISVRKHKAHSVVCLSESFAGFGMSLFRSDLKDGAKISLIFTIFAILCLNGFQE